MQRRHQCPLPEHRLIGTEDLAALARTDRFVYLKDTCEDSERFEKRLRAVQGTPLGVYQACVECLPESLAAGAPGFCGIISNSCVIGYPLPL